VNTPQEYITVFLFVLGSLSILYLIRLILSKWLAWDNGEKEKALQQNLNKSKEEILDLRKQVRILVAQYEEAVGKYALLREQYDQAARELVVLREEVEQMQKETVKQSQALHNRLLIAAVGSKEASLALDLASLRAVRADTGLRFLRIPEATPEKLKDALDQSRMMQSTTYLHLSIKSDNDGYQLTNEIVDANWLSENLEGVVILVVNGSNSTRIGASLGVVPYVITMSEEVPHRDASLFARAFWTEIGRGIGPSLALKRALERSPANMQEYVVRHWSEG
jgi:hypothetical protein